MKPGNAGGAKGCRKMETTALGFQNSTTAECRKARLGREPLDAVGSTTGNSVCRGCGRRLVGGDAGRVHDLVGDGSVVSLATQATIDKLLEIVPVRIR